MRWIAFLLLPVVLLLVAACEDQREQVESQNEAADQRVGTVPIFDMRTDDCFIDTIGFIEASVEGNIGEAGEITLVECSDPKADILVTRAFTVDRDGEWPGEGYLDEQAVGGCPGFAGASDEFSNYFSPTEDSWAIGDRTIVCLREVR